MYYGYWLTIGTLYLIILTFKDFSNKMIIDDRHNWFMMGLSFSLYSHVDKGIWYVLTLIAVSIALNYFLRKFKVLGGADISSLTWIFYGFGIIGFDKIFWFFVVFTVISLIYFGSKMVILQYMFNVETMQKTPFYIVILLSFVLNYVLFF